MEPRRPLQETDEGGGSAGAEMQSDSGCVLKIEWAEFTVDGYGRQEEEWHERWLQSFGPERLEAWGCHCTRWWRMGIGQNGERMRGSVLGAWSERCPLDSQEEMSSRQLVGVSVNFWRNHLRSSHFWNDAWMFSGDCQQEQIFLKIWRHWSKKIASLRSLSPSACIFWAPATWQHCSRHEGRSRNLRHRCFLQGISQLWTDTRAAPINELLEIHRAQMMCWAQEETQSAKTQPRESSIVKGVKHKLWKLKEKS